MVSEWQSKIQEYQKRISEYDKYYQQHLSEIYKEKTYEKWLSDVISKLKEPQSKRRFSRRTKVFELYIRGPREDKTPETFYTDDGYMFYTHSPTSSHSIYAFGSKHTKGIPCIKHMIERIPTVDCRYKTMDGLFIPVVQKLLDYSGGEFPFVTAHIKPQHSD